MTDEETLKELASKDRKKEGAALSRLLQGKGKMFLQHFVHKGLDRAAAEDVVQETLVKIFRQVDSYRAEGDSKNPANAWMWQIARNGLADYYRSRSREKNISFDPGQENPDRPQTVTEAKTSMKDSVKTTVYPYVEGQDRLRALTANVGLTQEGTAGGGGAENPLEPKPLWTRDEPDPSLEAEKRQMLDCVQKGRALFKKKDPDRAQVMDWVVEGFDGHEISERIGRTYDATRQYLTQCRKALAPYIKDCLPLLPA